MTRPDQLEDRGVSEPVAWERGCSLPKPHGRHQPAALARHVSRPCHLYDSERLEVILKACQIADYLLGGIPPASLFFAPKFELTSSCATNRKKQFQNFLSSNFESLPISTFRYWVFTAIMGHFVHSFSQQVSAGNFDNLHSTATEWVSYNLTLNNLRKGEYFTHSQ